MPQSMMDSGIRLATRAVHRVSAVGAAPETLRPPVSPLMTAEAPKAAGTLLARQGVLRQQRPLARGGLCNRDQFTAAVVSAARLSAIRRLLDRVSVTPRSDLFQTHGSDRTHP